MNISAGLDEIEQVGVGPALVHDVPGDFHLDLAVGPVLDGPFEGVETVPMSALPWPVAANPQHSPAHIGFGGGRQVDPVCSGRSSIVYDAGSSCRTGEERNMDREPWKSDMWFSSPWNYLPEVTEV